MITLTFDPALSRVVVTDEALPVGTASLILERSVNVVRWSPVRGPVTLTGGALAPAVSDYEFTPDVPNTYRLTYLDAGGVQIDQQTAAIIPTLSGVPWLKVIARPFLNQPVTVLDHSDVERPARAGVFDVIGSSLPVVVADVRGSRRFTLRLVTATPEAARLLELALAGGETVLLQVPAECDVPAGYFHVQDLAIARTARTSLRRVFALPVVETAAPGPDVVGAVSTWQTVLNTYSTWTELLAEHPTWADLLELVGTPEDVITE